MPLNAAVITVLIDIYVTHLERGEARRQLLRAAVPGEATFLDMARGSRATAADTCSSRVTWGHYLEYRLRKMPGAEVHPELLDELKAHFAALDRHGKGYIEWHDLESALLASRASSQPARLRPSDIQEVGLLLRKRSYEVHGSRGTLPSSSSTSSLQRPSHLCSSCGERPTERSAQRSTLPTCTDEEQQHEWDAAARRDADG